MQRLLPAPLVLLLTLALASSAQAAGHSVKALSFDVKTGPAGDQACTIVGDLYKPNDASAGNPAAAILTTNGFGGSKADQATFAKSYADRGYVVLSYSGLGFGGSTCKITLDDPDFDGKAGSQLVTFLGGGSAAKDGTKVDYVLKDAKAHDGQTYPNDPRVGMVGGSYGGQIQYAIAGQDPRLDTIIPEITWNDLSYSLAPNNTSQTSGVTYGTPGIEKFDWVSLFFGLGIVNGVNPGFQNDPARNVGCPNFDNRACTAKAQMDLLGYPNEATLALARHASVASYADKIRIPTLISQGQADTLFNLQESVATYKSLRANGVPAKLVWKRQGHSGAGAPGEQDHAKPETTYLGRTYLEWFDYYLRGIGDGPKLDFSYFRSYVTYTGDATAAYGFAPTYPAATPRIFQLSGSNALVRSDEKVDAGSASFAVNPAAPASYTETSALDQNQPVRDTQGTFAAFSSKPLDADLEVAGVPSVTLKVDAPVHAQSGSADPGGMLMLFVKLYDVAPDGGITLPFRLIAPVRVADPTKPFRVELPGIVHRFAKGHQVRLVVAASDAAYKNNNVAGPVAVKVDPATPSQLILPRLGAPDADAKKAPPEPGPDTSAPQKAGTGGPATPAAPAASTLPRKGSCLSRRTITVTLKRPKGDRVVRAEILVSGKRLVRKSGKDLRKVRFRLLGLKKGVYRIEIRTRTKKGKSPRSARTYRTCVKNPKR
jgi:ABC-2 type transport system ATP-binding protein